MSSDSIRWSALDQIAEREQRAFAQHTDLPQQARYVLGEGDGDPSVMVIGQNPGAQEDIRGRPFCGASGIIQRMLMNKAGLRTRDLANDLPANCWLTNAVKYRTPRNRQPTEEEIELARPYLRREWEAIGSPLIVVCVGRVAEWSVTGQGKIKHRTAEPCEFINSYGMQMVVWFMTHPSVVVRDKAMASVLEGQWERFARWFANE